MEIGLMDIIMEFPNFLIHLGKTFVLMVLFLLAISLLAITLLLAVCTSLAIVMFCFDKFMKLLNKILCKITGGSIDDI